MYLVHVTLRAPTPGHRPPPGLAALIRSLSGPADRIEHVCFHPAASPGPVVGVYLIADCLPAAEEGAVALCLRAVSTLPQMRGWTMTRAGVPLLAPRYGPPG
ncbi:hypothetical protein FHS43_005637 [Streptosporangium becharense]|uniref:Uncharacterized protein n=1 Tax=Streptosporangium becharense TaxID=1816182 RepID=A0A7W9IP04_9ACTN|nr:hypothetical protein [Streptosporangium becharense]MBB2914325.1 hypothetical protein [Streptosporangium becharense]MBB5823643.1 hypothetical protein [Streptosporangium becharense]